MFFFKALNLNVNKLSELDKQHGLYSSQKAS